MKKDYEITSDEGAVFARGQIEDVEAPMPEVGETYELEVDQHQEKALIAAGWIKEAEAKSKGGKS